MMRLKIDRDNNFKRLCSEWTCKTKSSAHAEILRHASRLMHAAEVQNFTYFPMPLVFLSRYQDHRLLWSVGQLPRASRLGPMAGRDTDLSCPVPISVFVALYAITTICQRHRQTDGVTDRRHACSRLKTKCRLNACTDINK